MLLYMYVEHSKWGWMVNMLTFRFQVNNITMKNMMKRGKKRQSKMDKVFGDGDL